MVMALKIHSVCQVGGWEPVPGAVPHQGELVERRVSLYVSRGQGLLQDHCPFWRGDTQFGHPFNCKPSPLGSLGLL